MVPNIVHYVFGLREQREPFHLLHYLSIESCRNVLQPERIYFHYKYRPFGPYFERLAPLLTMVETDFVDEVLEADYSAGLVPETYRYAHHADFIRLDALITHGGIYADIDTIFVRPLPSELRRAPFVIGREPPTRDERTGESRPSLCNALLIAEKGAHFARVWRERMGAELNGTWSNHSGFLSQALSEELSDEVRVVPEATFFPFSPDPSGLTALFERVTPLAPQTVSVHLWAHLWWERTRQDFARFHASWLSPPALRRAETTFAHLVRPFLPVSALASSSGSPPRSEASAIGRTWHYLSLDETSGYGIAADRCRAALEASGIEVDWTPFVPSRDWGLGYAPPDWLDPFRSDARSDVDEPTGKADAYDAVTADRVVVAHLVPEFFPLVRRRCPDAFLVGHLAWETDRLPAHWLACLEAVDLLIVPSQFSAEVVAAQTDVPIAVVPHVAPTVRSPTRGVKGRSSEPFVFYTIAEWNERKAPFKTIEAYLRAFSSGDPVLLVVKTSPFDARVALPAPSLVAGPGSSAFSLAQLLARYRDPPPVHLITRSMTNAEIATLHHTGGCFVSLARSEGFGLGTFDAAAHGVPVVTTGFGGHLDYLAGSPYLVHYALVPVDDPAGWPSYSQEQHWAEPDLDHAAALLREVAANRGHAAAIAAPLSEDILWRYRPEAIAMAFRAAVEDHYRTGRNGHRRQSAAERRRLLRGSLVQRFPLR